MARSKVLVLVAGAVSAFTMAAPARAAILSATVSGIVTGQRDGNIAFDLGVFEPGFTALAGDAFSVKYSFDLDDATFRTPFVGAFSPATVFAGGAWSPLPSANFGHAALTIGGRTIDFDGVSFGSVTAGTGERTFYVIDATQPGAFFSVVTNLFDPTSSFPATLESTVIRSGVFDRDADLASDSPSSFYINYGDGRVAAGGLSASSIKLSVSAVPELESWTMMIAGLGAMGAVLRRARKSARAAGGNGRATVAPALA